MKLKIFKNPSKILNFNYLTHPVPLINPITAMKRNHQINQIKDQKLKTSKLTITLKLKSMIRFIDFKP